MSPRRAERVHGRILRAWTEDAGATLAADANPGDLVLTVDDVSPFNDDGEGGWVKLGDQVVAYTTVDDDTATITLTSPVTELVEEDEYVAVWNDLYQEVDTVQRVHVVVDGHEDNTDHLEAVVADTIEGLDNGDRGAPAEGCVLERDGDEWELVRVKGRPSKASGVRFKREELFTLTASGQQDLTLTRDPLDESVQVRVNGLDYHPADGWARNGRTLSLHTGLDPRAGDHVSVQYAYRVAAQRPGGVLLDWKSSGYSTLLVARTDATDYSGASVDTSSWTAATGDFGGGPSEPALSAATWWPRESDLWVRHDFPAATQATVQVLIEDNCTIWVNGQLIASTPENDNAYNGMVNPRVFEVPAGVLNAAAPNVIAVRARDEPNDPGSQATGDNTYLDLFIEGR